MRPRCAAWSARPSATSEPRPRRRPSNRFQLGRVKLDRIPPNRLSALARYGLGTKAAKLERASEPKRTAMVTAVMRHLEAKAIDDALDLFEILMATRLISAAKRSTNKERVSTLPQLEKASSQPGDGLRPLRDPDAVDLDDDDDGAGD